MTRLDEDHAPRVVRVRRRTDGVVERTATAAGAWQASAQRRRARPENRAAGNGPFVVPLGEDGPDQRRVSG